MQRPGQTLSITFATAKRWKLPKSVRQLVMDCCCHAHGTRFELHAAVVMPDHVHLLLTPGSDVEGNTFGLSQILNSIKGASSHAVNRALGRHGPVWQSESFDHVLRSEESIRGTAEYICANPVRAGLVGSEDEYSWLGAVGSRVPRWEKVRDHRALTAADGCATKVGGAIDLAPSIRGLSIHDLAKGQRWQQ